MDPSSEIQYCPECGISNRVKDKFCRKCGTRLIPPTEPILPTKDEDRGKSPVVDPNATTVVARNQAPVDSPTPIPTPRPIQAARPETPLPQQQVVRADTPPPANTTPRPTIRPIQPLDTPRPTGRPGATTPVPVQADTTQRTLLIGSGVVAAVILFALLIWGMVRAVAGVAPPDTAPLGATWTPVIQPTVVGQQPTSTISAELGILQTAQAEQDATATALVVTPEPSEPSPTAPPQPTPSEAPTATSAPSPTAVPQLVVTTFSPEQAQTARSQHDSQVAQYQRLLFESFEEGDRTKERWAHSIDGRALRNNRYELLIETPNTYNFDLWKQQPPLGPNYTAELEVRFLSLATFSRIGLAFDVQDDTTKNWLYLIGSDGFWYIFRNEQLVGSGQLPEKFAIADNTPYVLWVWRLESGIQFFFNGELIGVVPSETLAGDYPIGRVGVVGVSGRNASDVPVTVVVDNMLVARPS
ncbi:MAG: hypothetical protein Fur005_34900 [Roseiflexaceae bacterium]